MTAGPQMDAPECERCERPLDRPGALAFGPPNPNNRMTLKVHICHLCWPIVMRYLHRGVPT